MEIYITRNDEQFGPYSRDEVTSYLEDGSLTPADLAWHEEQADWKPLGELVAVPATTGKIIRIEQMPPAPVEDVPLASKQESATFGFAKPAIVILLLFIGGGDYYYLVYGAGQALGHQWSVKAVSAYHRLVYGQAPPSLSEKEPAIQTAAVADTTATPEQDAAPSNSSTPVQERPRKLDWPTFVASPSLWPKVVVLTTPVSFPVVLLDGRVAGLARMPAGTPVKFDGVVGNKLKIEYQGGVQTVSPNATDLEQRLLASGVTK
jgi:hypothetical protein